MIDYLKIARRIADEINETLAEDKKLDYFTLGRLDSKIEAALLRAFDDGFEIAKTDSKGVE